MRALTHHADGVLGSVDEFREVSASRGGASAAGVCAGASGCRKLPMGQNESL